MTLTFKSYVSIFNETMVLGKTAPLNSDTTKPGQVNTISYD